MLIFIVLFINTGVSSLSESFFPYLLMGLPRFYIFNKNNNYDDLIAVLDIKPETYIYLFIQVLRLYAALRL